MKTYKTIVHILILLTVVVCVLPTPVQATATSSSFQRKTWYDGTRYWRAYNDTANSRIRFDYSPDGTTWTENTSARIAVNTNDFSIEADSANAFIVYATSNDIRGRVASSYPGTGFGWGTEVTVYKATGPVGWWKFNENTGTSTNDSSGNNFTGTLGGGTAAYRPTWITGEYGSGLNFDGTDDYVSVNDNAALTNFNDMTVETWVWVNVLPSVRGQAAYIVQKKHDASPYSSYALWIKDEDNDQVQFVWYNANGDEFGRDCEFSLTAGQWYHVAGTKSGSTLRCYINGVDYSETNNPTVTGTYFDSNQELHIGANDYYQQRLNGKMDDVRIYGYARTPDQIIEDMNNGNATAYNYSYPVITRDSSGYVWVTARYTDGSVYYMKAIKNTSGTNALPIAGTHTVYSISSTSNSNSNVYGVLVPLTSGQMYAVWVRGTTIEGKKYSGSWDGSATSIATGVTGITNSISAVPDSSGYAHLVYIDSSGHTVYQERTSSWQTAVTLDSNSGNSYPTIAINTANADLYAFWIRGSHIYYKKGVSPYASGNWDASATDWKTTGTNVDVTSDYSAVGISFAEWYDGSAVQWDKIGGGASGCSSVPLNGNYTVTGSCTFPGNVDGVDSGTGTTNTATLSIGTAGTPGYLTVLSNQIIANGSISLVNGSITIIKGIPGGKIWPYHPLYYTDADSDGYPAVNATTKYATASSTVARRDAGLDYNDASASVHPGTACNGNCSLNETNGTCTLYTSGQHFCTTGQTCDASSTCVGPANVLLHMDGTDASTTFTDGSGKTWTARGTAQIDTAQSKFGGASGLFDGNSDWIDTPDHADWQLDGGSNSNKWTIDFWLRMPSTPSSDLLFFEQRVDATHFITFFWYKNGPNDLDFYVNAGTIDIMNAWTPSANTWYHIALVKNGTSGYMMFVNGTQVGSTQTNTSTLPDLAAIFKIGQAQFDQAAPEYLSGWIDEFHYIKGTATWTSNFTPPTAPY